MTLVPAMHEVLAEAFAGEHITAEMLLPALLPFAVEMQMLNMHCKGGPTEADWQRAREWGKHASEGPDQQEGDPDTFVPHPRLGLADGSDLLYAPQSGKGATATMFNELAFALSVMAFAPGGVHFMGMGWHSVADEAESCSRCRSARIPAEEAR